LNSILGILTVYLKQYYDPKKEIDTLIERKRSRDFWVFAVAKDRRQGMINVSGRFLNIFFGVLHSRIGGHFAATSMERIPWR